MNNKNEFLEDTEEKTIAPYAQILNDRKEFGLFVPIEQAEKVGFRRDYMDSDLRIWHVSTAGTEIEGLLFKAPAMLIVRESPLLMNIVDQNGKAESYLFDSEVHAQYKEREVAVYKNRKRRASICQQKWLIFLLDQDKQLLHEIPLTLTLKNRMPIEFNGNNKSNPPKEGWYAHRYNFNKFFWKGQGRQGGARFNSLIVFSPVFGTAMVGLGDGKQSVGCVIKSIPTLTMENHEDYFVGFDKDVKTYVQDVFDKSEDFCKYPGFGNCDSSNINDLSSLAAKPKKTLFGRARDPERDAKIQAQKDLIAFRENRLEDLSEVGRAYYLQNQDDVVFDDEIPF